jgi:hypothetical protein
MESVMVNGKELVLFANSGHDAFHVIDPETGGIVWEWKSIPGGPPFCGLSAEEFKILHVSGTLEKDYKGQGSKNHFNGIWFFPNQRSFLASCMDTGTVIEIPLLDEGGNLIPQQFDFDHSRFWVKDFDGNGVHSAIVDRFGCLIFGSNHTLCWKKPTPPDRKPVACRMDRRSWIKFVREIPGVGYIFTHQRGVDVVDYGFRTLKSLPLPGPWGLTMLEVHGE